MSTIDVIVPCYRYGHFLRECVASVLSDSEISVRVLVIDDASPDDSAEIGKALAQEDSRVTFRRHAANKGHIATYNEGIEWASADYLLVLSADDYLLPGALGRSVRFMDTHPEVGFTFGRVVLSAESGITQQVEAGATADRESPPRIFEGLGFIRLIERSRATNIVPTPTAVVRTELQKRVGGYRPELPHTGDLEMWLRLAAHASVGKFDSFQAVYRQHGANMQRNYYDHSWQMPDLEQRKVALECFVQACSHVLPNASQIRARLLRALARDALVVASAAFNGGAIEASVQLSEFAVEVSPGARWSLESALLAFKRAMGVRVWRAARPLADWLRTLLRRKGN